MAFVIAFLLSYDQNYKDVINLFDSTEFKYIPNSQIVNSDQEIVFVYITSSTCPYCNDEQLLRMIDNIKYELKGKADELGYNFSAIAVGIENNTNIGMSHFNKSGHYDEIILGNSWNNLGSLNYIRDDFKGVAMTPQIIITKRQYQVLDPNNFNDNIGLINEIELVRKAGVSSITNWYEQGLNISSKLLTKK